MNGHFKIIKSEELSAKKGEDRFIVVSSTGKLLNDHFGDGYLTKITAFNGFKLFNKMYKDWKKKQHN